MKLASLVPIAGAMLVVSVALSFIHPWGDVRSPASANAPLLKGSDVPAGVQKIVENSCMDCHSSNTHWPLYSRLAPGSWLLERDVHEGRTHLNLSQWQQYDMESQIDLFSKIASEARSGEMPVKQYLLLHPKARLSSSEQELLYNWARSERKRIKQQLAMQHGEMQEKPANSGQGKDASHSNDQSTEN